MNIAFYTLGCKLNQSESEALASTFESWGFSICQPSQESQIYIINSCTVTSMAEQKARRMIRKFSRVHSESIVIVTGCYAQLDKEEINDLGKNVIVLGMDGKSRLMDLPEFLSQQKDSPKSLLEQVNFFLSLNTDKIDINRFRFNSEKSAYHSRAFLKIQDGCNNSCSYCRIPLARGEAISLAFEDVIKRARAIFEAGYFEVVLTGVNISAWTFSDATGSLADLIKGVADVAQSYHARIRLSSLEPDRLNSSLIQALTHPAVAPHFHLPLQSMSQSVLTRMNRHYQVENVMQWIARLKTERLGCYFAADIMTGFDGESDEEFQQSYQIMQQLNFAHLHVFPFSPREGTAAFKPKKAVAQRIRDERAALFRQLSVKGYKSYEQVANNQFANLLVEDIKRIEQDETVQSLIFYKVSGITENYLRISTIVTAKEFQKRKMAKRQIYPVRLEMRDNKLFGVLI